MSTATAPEQKPTPEQKKHRNPWIWVCAVLAVAAAGLLIWALTIQSDLDKTNDDVADLQAQVDKGQDSGSAVVTAAKSLYDDLAQQLGATTEDLEATQNDLDKAKQATADAEQDAAAAKQTADGADDELDKAKAEADQAKAEVVAAESKASVAADCAKAYVSSFGALFEGEGVRAQAPAVREQLQGITADCQAALG